MPYSLCIRNCWGCRAVWPPVWVFKSSSLIFFSYTSEVCSDFDSEHRPVKVVQLSDFVLQDLAVIQPTHGHHLGEIGHVFIIQPGDASEPEILNVGFLAAVWVHICL